MANESMITTIDNPYNYFTQFDEWLAFDTEQGYNTLSYLARIAKTSPDMTTEEEDAEIGRAIDEILRLNVLGIYKRVWKKGTSEG